MGMKIKWKDLTPAAKKWVSGWVLIMRKDMSQEVVWHDKFDDTMIFYYPIPQSLTREQFEKTEASKEVKVDWKG